jgi:serine/threonine-protein kinase RIO1
VNTLSSWEAQTIEMIRLIEQDIHEAMSQLDYLQAAKESLEQALRIYRKRIGSEYTQAVESIKPEEFKGKTLREILHLIAGRNDKVIVVKDAIKSMKEANVFGTPQHADSVVYSILSRSPEFAKVGRGVYRLNGEHKEGKSVRKERIPGLKQAIQELKTVNPDMTKRDIRDTLIKRGFDFKGRNPNKAVHMLWVNLGYAKKDKQIQQDLFG